MKRVVQSMHQRSEGKAMVQELGTDAYSSEFKTAMAEDILPQETQALWG